MRGKRQGKNHENDPETGKNLKNCMHCMLHKATAGSMLHLIPECNLVDAQ